MALLPIFTNLPIFKLFRGAGPADSSVTPKDTGEDRAAQTPRDVVEISAAARNRVADEARATAVQTREILEGDHSLTLGLDPAFAG